MSTSPKNSVGWLARKAVALFVVYAFFATSVWSVAPPGEVLAGRNSGDFMSSRALTQSLANNLASPLSDLHGSVSTHSNSSSLLAAPNAVTGLASKVPMAMIQSGGGTASSISFNFNATAIPAGDTIWFSAVLKLNGSVPDHPVSIAVHNSIIQFTAGSTNFSLNVPSSVVTFSPTTTTSTASFDTANNSQPVWLQNQLNPQPSGNTLLQAFAFPVPAGGLPGGIKNVTWTNDFSSDTSNITLNWQWAAAVYTGCVNTTYNSDDVKPTDDSSASIYKNSDHAGTPEACKSNVTQGATGGGASNYTGSLSGTASVTPPVVAAAPVITGSINPAPNANGWNNMNVTVSFTCSDANFAIVTCPAPVTVSSEGANQVITGTAVDQVGGKTANTSVTVNIDKTSPTITATPTSSGGSGSVLTMPVTINFTCTDAVSGVVSCPSPIQVTTAGFNQVFSGTATDKAGNTASTSISVTTENAPLAITASVAPPPVNGWNNSNVTVSYQCMGGVPPMSCPQATTVSAEGAGQIISATATDAASQSSTVSTTINIDKTPPTLTATTAPAANAAGWNISDVTITYTCSDTPSGVAFCPPAQVVSAEGKAQQITATDVDIAHNSTTTSTTINLEKTAPNITASVSPAPNAAGWNNADVTVSFTCAPSVSDIVNCPTPVSVTTEAAGQQISGTVTDQAGRSNTATVTVNLDKTPPSIGITAPVSAGFINNNHLPITVSYSDSGSGIDSTTFHITIDGADQTAAFTASATGASGSPAAAFTDGVHTITVSISDVAGNPATATSTFTVDTIPPQVTITQPANGFFTNAASLVVSGTVTAAAPVTVTVTVQGTQVPLQGNTFTTTVPTQGSDGGQTITIVATDAAGNSTPVTLTVNIDRTPPTITGVIAPAPNGNGWNNTPVTVSFTCADNGSRVAVCPAPVQVNTEGANQAVSGTATDKAGNSAQATVTVNIDETAPTIAGTAAPPPNAAGWNNTNVVISYVCSDSLSGIATCPPPATVSTEGAAQQISAQATDQAGNRSSVTTTLNIDKTPPVVTATAAPSPNAAGWNNTNVTVSFSCTDNLSGVATCPQATTVTTEGQNQNISGQATDVAGNTATGSISLSIDRTPPTIVQLSTPDHISRLHGGQVSVTVNDNFTVTQVMISVNGNTLGTFTAAPYQADLEVPSGANPGDTLTVTAVATDEAGNTQTSSRGVRVAADGVIVGQVLSDATSFPIQNAVVQSVGSTSVSDQTDDRGRYSLQASDSHLFLTVTNASPATTTVEREVFVQEGVGTVPVDARLTPLATASAVGSAGGTLTAGNISITVPAGVVGNGTSFRLTPLTGQGLPGLLPLGWSPLAAFDLRATSSALNLSAAVAQLPNTVSHLVTYNAALHAWTMVTPNLQAVSGTVTVTVPAPGAYALVITDTVTPAITIPNPGDALVGINMQLLDPAATSSGRLSPSTLPPGGGTATATLGVQTSASVPSGTVIQANISETFALTSGDVVSEQSRSEDIVIYNALAPANSTLGAQFAVTPSQTFTNSQLLTGKVHLDILAGREGVRGQPGGSNPLTLTDGVSTLSVPGSAVNEDTAISLQSISLEDFVPTTSSQSPIQEVLVDFSGDTLNVPAQLSISATGLNPADTYLLTMVQRIDGVPHMVLAALAQINGGNLTSVASPGLPGVVQGGEYVFYDIPAPMGFVKGTVSSSAGPVQALAQTDSLQIVSITGADGRYIVPALAGSANVKASAPHTNLIGSASVQVTAGQTAQVNITLSGAVTTAVVSPADGTLGVPTSTTITITTTAPLNPQSIVQSNLVLLQGTATSGTPVPVQPFVLSSSGTVLSFAPVSNLQPATQYTIRVSGLADTFGGAVVVPTSSFTTKAVAPLNFDPNAITFSFPDQNGNIHVTAPAGSLPPGTQILIIDENSGLVLSLTALNDGSVSGDFAGTINDVLQISVKDPNGATTSFTRSQFVAPDGSVAVGPGGGTVTGSGGVAMLIPAGALDRGVTFKVEAFGPDLFPERPNVPGGSFGGGLKITSPGSPAFKKEVRVSFPMPPDAPPGAFFQVFARVHTTDNSQVAFEDVDFALPQGQGSTAQVVTASFPFRGLIDLNMLLAQADFQGQLIETVFDAAPVAEFGLEADMYLIWTASNALPGISLGGSITGRVRYPVVPGGTLPDGTINKTGDTVFVGVSNAFVTVDSNPPSHAVIGGATGTRTQPDGTFTFSDPHYNGGSVNVIAYDGDGHAVTASAIEVVSLTDKTVNDFAGPLLKFYRNVAFADVVVPAPVPPPPPPQIGISLFTENPNSTPRPGLRVPVNGILATGTNYVVAFKLGGQVQQQNFSVTTNGAQESTQPDQPIFNSPTDPNNKDPNTLDLELTQYFNPGTAGIYTITATGLTAFNQPITVSKTVLAVAAGGSNNTINVGTAPAIVSVSPDAGATGVAVDSFIQVLFSEPVTNLAGHVSLVPSDGSTHPPVKLSGFSYLDTTNSNPIANLSATDAVSAVTIQPTTGLKFGTKYTLQITSDVVDLDNVADPTKPALPLQQPQTPYSFTTFGPQPLGGTPAFSSTRAAVMGDRAYVGKSVNAALAEVDIFNISDPSNPSQVGGTTVFEGRAQDVAGEESASVIGGDNLLAVASNQGATEIGFPANLWLFDVIGDQFKRVGAVSVTSSVVNEGQIFRVVLKDNFAYNLVFPIGVRAVDLQQGITDYNNVFPTNPLQFGQQVITDGEGFARDAVVNTVPLKVVDRNQNGTPLLDAQGNIIMITPMLSDLKAGNYPGAANLTDGQTAVVVVGHIPFIVVDPFGAGQAAVLYPSMVNTSGQPELDQSPLKDSKGQSLITGGAVALVQLTDSQLDAGGNVVQKQVAVVVGSGKALDPANPGQFITGPVLTVVDLTTLSQPTILGMVPLDTFPTDVVLFGTTALVGTGANKVLLVNLEDPRNPVNAGSITNSIFGDRLAITKDGVLIGTSFNANNGGLNLAELNVVPVIVRVTPYASVDQNFKLTAPINVDYALQGQTSSVAAANLLIQQDGVNIGTIPLPSLKPGVHTVTIPVGTKIVPPPVTVKFTIARQDGSPSTYETPLDQLPADTLDVPGASATLQANQVVLPTTPDQPPDIAPAVISVQPDHVIAGQGDTTLSVTGASLSSVTVTQADGSSSTLTVNQDSSGNQTFVLPAPLISSPGFLVISSGSGGTSIAISVLDSTLPSLGSNSTISIENLFSSADATSNPLIDVFGTALVSGMQVVFVRDAIPVVSLPAQFDPALGLTIPQPNWFETIDDDRSAIAVLTADRLSMSSGVPLPSFTSAAREQHVPADTPLPDNSALAFQPNDVEITGAFRNITVANNSSLVQAAPLAQITLRGVGFTQGTQITVAADRGDQTITQTTSFSNLNVISRQSDVTLDPSDGLLTQHPDLAEGSVTVPAKIAASSFPTIAIVALQADGQVAGRSSDVKVNVAPLAIPFGGRVMAGAYQDSSNNTFVLTPTEAAARGNQSALTLMSTATITIKTTDEGSPLAQVETESGDTAGYVHIRGLSASSFPATLPQDRINRPTAQVLVNGKMVRTLNVYYVNLGSTYVWHDQDIARAANNHQIPPQYLKSQVLQESSHFQGNFRYEQSTIDFKTLTGDGSPQIAHVPYCLYAMAGTYLSPDQSVSPQMVFNYSPTAPAQTAFTIGRIKRRASVSMSRWVDPRTTFTAVQNAAQQNPAPFLSYITELDSAVQAEIDAVDPKTGAITNRQHLLLVRDGPTWVKYGNSKEAGGIYAHGLVRQIPVNFQPSPSQFTVNYDTGLLTIGRALNPGERLVVSQFQSLPGNKVNNIGPTTQCAGQSFGLQVGTQNNRNAMAPDLNDTSIIFSQFNLSHNWGESLYDFFNNNISQRPSGNWLSATASDERVEFHAAGSASTSVPTTLLDPKYQYATAQPYASASYGALQLTLGAWTNSRTGQTLQTLFNIKSPTAPNFRSIFELIRFTDGQGSTKDSNLEDFAVKNSLELGAAYSQTFQSDGGFGSGACVKACNQDSWAQGWSSVFVDYNNDSSQPQPFYAAGKDGKDNLVKIGDQCFTPTAYYLVKPAKGSTCAETSKSTLY